MALARALAKAFTKAWPEEPEPQPEPAAILTPKATHQAAMDFAARWGRDAYFYDFFRFLICLFCFGFWSSVRSVVRSFVRSFLRWPGGAEGPIFFWFYAFFCLFSAWEDLPVSMAPFLRTPY